MTFTSLAHRAVSHARIYDLVQWLVGVQYVHRRLRRHIDQTASDASVLDVGGGTGLLRALWPPQCRYLCVDADEDKLIGCLQRHPGSAVVRADATRMPIASGSFDAAVCMFVAHHLSDADLEQVIRESARVLKENGKFFLVEPLWRPSRMIGRLLWRYDRGSFPRSANDLRAALSARFALTRWECFAVLHQYLLCVGEKRTALKRVHE